MKKFHSSPVPLPPRPTSFPLALPLQLRLLPLSCSCLSLTALSTPRPTKPSSLVRLVSCLTIYQVFHLLARHYWLDKFRPNFYPWMVFAFGSGRVCSALLFLPLGSSESRGNRRKRWAFFSISSLGWLGIWFFSALRWLCWGFWGTFLEIYDVW